MQVELVAYGIFAAPQPAQDGLCDAVAAKGELVAGLDVEIVGVERKRIREDLRLVGATRGGARPAARAFRHPLRVLERPDAAHGGAKQLAVFVLDSGILRPRAGATGLTV